MPNILVELPFEDEDEAREIAREIEYRYGVSVKLVEVILGPRERMGTIRVIE